MQSFIFLKNMFHLAAVRKAQKQGGSAAAGALWWVERELAEAKKYKPKSKQ